MLERMKNHIKVRDWILFVAMAITFSLLVWFFPEPGSKSLEVMWNILRELMIILPGVMILMGLFSVWVSKQMVVNYLGRGSGLKGIGLSILFGTLPTGPLYIAFPIALSLFKKGARVMNVVVFISAWACIKLPQEMVEIQFMGLKFAGVRIALTIPLVALVGWIMEQALGEEYVSSLEESKN